jgi:RNA polymerase sigma-70 factor (ECF subfamily)
MMVEIVVSREMDQQDLANDDDHALVRSAQGDPLKFVRLYDRYIHRIYRYVLVRVHDIALAEDLTSQIFLKALENLPRYQPNAPFSAWLFTIARNTILTNYRKARLEVEYDEELHDPTLIDGEDILSALAIGNDIERLHRLLQQLTEREREILYLRFAGDLSYQEIARITRRSHAAVKMAMHRLLRRLQSQMEAK